MRFLGLVMLVISGCAYGSLEGYVRPSDKEIYSNSDVVAVIRTLSGEVISLDKGGGIKVEAEVLEAIKGVEKGQVIEIYYAARCVGGIYMATLVWDPELKAYQYFDGGYDFELFEINTKEQNFLDPEKMSKRRGLSGKPVSRDGVYYLPGCKVGESEDCQLQFDHVQFMLGKHDINNHKRSK